MTLNSLLLYNGTINIILIHFCGCMLVSSCVCTCAFLALECQVACLLPQQSIGQLWAGPVDNMRNCLTLAIS